MNPRYIAYCSAHGLTSDQMKRKDAKRFPGGIMTGFILWIHQAKNAFLKVHPEYFIGGDSINLSKYSTQWDSWLTNYKVVV